MEGKSKNQLLQYIINIPKSLSLDFQFNAIKAITGVDKKLALNCFSTSILNRPTYPKNMKNKTFTNLYGTS